MAGLQMAALSVRDPLLLRQVSRRAPEFPIPFLEPRARRITVLVSARRSPEQVSSGGIGGRLHSGFRFSDPGGKMGKVGESNPRTGNVLWRRQFGNLTIGF